MDISTTAVLCSKPVLENFLLSAGVEVAEQVKLIDVSWKIDTTIQVHVRVAHDSSFDDFLKLFINGS